MAARASRLDPHYDQTHRHHFHENGLQRAI